VIQEKKEWGSFQGSHKKGKKVWGVSPFEEGSLFNTKTKYLGNGKSKSQTGRQEARRITSKGRKSKSKRLVVPPIANGRVEERKTLKARRLGKIKTQTKTQVKEQRGPGGKRKTSQ